MSIPAVGEPFRQYRILARAGEGAMGVVLHAEDTRLGRQVALKFLTGIGRVDAAAAERVRLEARSLAALKHAHIVTIYDMDEVDGAPYLAMEWVSGTTLEASMDSRRGDQDEFIRIALPVAEALAAAHSRNIVHRDIKPGNILLTGEGDVKLVDFGLARFCDEQLRVTRGPAVLGTPAYMSPEQAMGDDVGPASDIYSFGVLAYELLAGALPFEGDSYPAILYAIAHSPHVPLAERCPGISSTISALVDRCLEKRPEDRFVNGSELAQEVHHIARSRTVAGFADRPPAAKFRIARSLGSPEIRYCRTPDGASIAYAVHGSGPVLVRVLGWFTHLEMEWEWPALRLLWERLGETHTVVRFDGRGIGLSSRWEDDFTEDTRQADLAAVLDAVGEERVALFGVSEGGWTAAHFAAFHPERVSHLIIYGSYARGAELRPGFDAEEERAVQVLMRKGWGRDTPEIRQIFTTAYFGADADPGLTAHFNQIQRAAADGSTAVRYLESLNRRQDARQVFAGISTPSLVIHCRDDQIMSFEEGRLIAATIPGAKFLPLPSGTHYFPVEDEVTHRIADAIAEFTSSP